MSGDIVAVRMAGIENIFVFDKDFVKTIMQRPEEELPQLAGVTSNGTFLPLSMFSGDRAPAL